MWQLLLPPLLLPFPFPLFSRPTPHLEIRHPGAALVVDRSQQTERVVGGKPKRLLGRDVRRLHVIGARERQLVDRLVAVLGIFKGIGRADRLAGKVGVGGSRDGGLLVPRGGLGGDVAIQRETSGVAHLASDEVVELADVGHNQSCVGGLLLRRILARALS